MKERLEYKAAAKRYQLAVERAFPVGAIVLVDKGLWPFNAIITRHVGSWWHDPSELEGMNTKTKKIRRFSECCILREKETK